MEPLVLYRVQDRVGYITLNRPEKRNALSFEFVSEIKKAFSVAGGDPSCKVIVLEAKGEAFCAGADLAYLQQLQQNTEAENRADSMNLAELFSMIYLSKKVVISKVEGPALAGGCGLATVGDFCFATPSSLFGYTEVKIGFVPAIVMVFLLKKVGEKLTRELLLSGDTFDAEKAMAYSLVYRTLPSEQIGQAVHDFAVGLCRKASSQSLETVREMIAKLQQPDLSERLAYAADLNVRARSSEDCKKGIAAFLNKERLAW